MHVVIINRPNLGMNENEIPSKSGSIRKNVLEIYEVWSGTVQLYRTKTDFLCPWKNYRYASIS